MNENAPTVLLLLRRTHGAERDCQVSRDAKENHAVDCVRVRLDAWGLSDTLFKEDSESAAQVLVDVIQVERSEEAVVEESPKCLHQSGSEAEDTAQRIESLTQVASKSIASSRPDRQALLSQPQKRDDGYGTRSGVKGKEYDGPLAQVGETMRSKAVCCEVAEPESRWVTRARLDRTGEKSESVVGTASRVELSQPIRRPVKDDQWQRDGFTMLMSVPSDTEKLTVESMAENRRKHVLDFIIQDETPGGLAHLMASLRVTTKCHRRLGLSTNPNVIGGDPTVRRLVKGSRSVGVEASEEQFATHLDTVQHIRQTAGLKEVRKTTLMDSPAKRAHTIPFPLTQALLLSAGREAMLLPGDAMRISTQCEEYVCRPDVKVVFETASEFRDHYNGEVLDWSLTTTGRQRDHTDREVWSAHTKTQVQETVDREGHPHQRVQQIQEKPSQAESRDTRHHCWSVRT